MSTVSQLIGKVSAAGFAVVVKDGNPSLKRQRGEKALSPELLHELKNRRDEVLEWFGSANADFRKPLPVNCESSTVGETTTTHSLTTCAVCLAEVNEAEMRALPKGMWMEMCGHGVLYLSQGQEPCPYRPKSLWSNPPGTK